MKKYLLVLALFTPFFAFAKSNITLSEGVLTLEGECTKPITVTLQEKGEIIYSAGAPCENGEYNFRDDLSKWGIAEKSYELWVDTTLLAKDFSYTVTKEPDHPLISIGSETNNQPENIPEAVAVTTTTATEQLRDGLQKVDAALQALEQKSGENSQENTIKTSLITFMRNAFEVLSSFFIDFEKSDVEVQIPENQDEAVVAPDVTDAQVEESTQPEVIPEESTPDVPEDQTVSGSSL